MPFKSGKTPKDLNANLTKLAKKVDDELIPKGLFAASTVGLAYAKQITPIATSTLINSQYGPIITDTPKGKQAASGYTASYAADVHYMPGKLKGKPRAGVKSFTAYKGTDIEQEAFTFKDGNFWDPDAEPRFLTKGYENNMDEVNNAFLQGVKL